MTFQGTDVNNNELEFAIIERQYGYPSSSLLETGYYPVNTNIGLTGLFRPNERFAYTVYIRRKDGGILTPSDMERSLIILYINGQQTVKQTTAIPESWLNTTVPTISSPIDTVTTVRTDMVIDETGVSNSLEYPPVIESALVQLMSIISTVLTLKYIRFLLGFAIITGLIAWFLH